MYSFLIYGGYKGEMNHMNIQVNAIELFYTKAGKGQPLILLHGNGENHHIFDKISAKLEQNFTIYAIDSRNHGESTKTNDYSYETMAEDIYSFIRKLNLEKVKIIGFSDGAIISLLLSMNHPDVLDRMALFGINLKPSDFTDENYQYVKETYQETKDPLFKLMLEQPNIELDDVRNIQVPTFLVGAEHDLYRPELFTKLEEALPNAELLIMNGHDHGSYIVDQDIMYDPLISFFSV